VFENRALKKIFGPKREEVTGGWRKLYIEELCDLYSSPGIIRIIKSRMRWAEHVVQMREKRNACRILARKLEEKTPLGRPRHRWVDNIKMYLVGIRLGGGDWIGLAQNSGKCM
jgi:hypothetical protein